MQPQSPNNPLGATAFISKSELNRILDTYELEAPVQPHADRRKHSRGRRRMCDAYLEIDHIGGGQSSLNCCTRNISTRGVCLITNVFVHPKSTLRVTLERNDGNPELIPGAAAHCRHIEGRIHEVGIHFDRKINPLFFLLADDNNELYAQQSKEKPEGLNGWVIYISSCKSDVELFEHYLRGTDVKCKAFERTGVAIDEIKKGMYDIVIIDADANDFDPGDAASAIRDSGFLGELLVLTADEDVLSASNTNPAVSDVLKKPFQPITLQSKLAACFERTAGLADADEIKSTMAHDSAMASLLSSYIHEMHSLAVAIERAITDNEIKALTKCCLRIKGTGSNFGFEQLATLSAGALDQLKSSGSIDATTPQLRRLAIMCRKAAA